MVIFRFVDNIGDDFYMVNPFLYWQIITDGGFGILLVAIEPIGAIGQLLFAKKVFKTNEHLLLLK